MPAVTFTLPSGPQPDRVQAELTLIDTNGKPGSVIVLPITGPEANFKNLEGNWEQVAMPGRKPVLARAADKLATLDLKVTVAAPDGGRLDEGGYVEGVLNQLAGMCGLDSAAQPVALTWGTFDTSTLVTETGLWHLQTVEVDSELRQPGTNNITRAQVSITLVEASEAPTASRNVNPGWSRPPAPPSSPPPAPTYVTMWTVRAGDTAYSIAAAVYGNPEPGWRVILDANNIANPTSLAVGQVLVIPNLR